MIGLGIWRVLCILGFPLIGIILFSFAAYSQSPPPDNIFTSQLAVYHTVCSGLDGGDHSCDPGDPCTSDAAKWVRLCDRNADLDRDFHATLTSLSEWEDLFWTPSDSTKALAEEHYPDTGAGKPYQRFFVPMCEDGSNTTKGETTCADGKPIIQCTDGTRPVFYYDPGTTDKWIIHIQSGNITCSTSSRGQNCWQLDEEQGRENLAHFSTAWAENDNTIAVKGLMRSSNSPFADYNRVFIDKCVGDRNRGDNTVQNYPFVAKDGTSVGQGTVYFHGFRILKALLPLLNQGGAGNGIALLMLTENRSFLDTRR